VIEAGGESAGLFLLDGTRRLSVRRSTPHRQPGARSSCYPTTDGRFHPISVKIRGCDAGRERAAGSCSTRRRRSERPGG